MYTGHALDSQEEHPGDNDEIQSDGQKLSPAKDRTLLLCIGIGQARLNLCGQRRVERDFREEKEAVIRQPFLPASLGCGCGTRKKARKKFRAFVISVEGGLNSPYRPYRPCHRQA